MITSTDVNNLLSYLNDDRINYKSSMDIASVVNVIDRITQNNHNIDSIYSIADKILSFQSKFEIQEAQQMNGSIVKYENKFLNN